MTLHAILTIHVGVSYYGSGFVFLLKHFITISNLFLNCFLVASLKSMKHTKEKTKKYECLRISGYVLHFKTFSISGSM